MIFAEKRVENFARGNVATKPSSFVHEINHSRARVMDESGRRKRGNTSGSLKRSWSQQGWRLRGWADRRTRTLWEISVLRPAEKSTVAFGWREKLPRRFRGIHDAGPPIVLFKTFDHASPFFIEYSFVRPYVSSAHPGQLIPANKTRPPPLCSSFPPPVGKGNALGWKGRWLLRIELFIRVSLKGGARSGGKLAVNSELINIADRGYGIVAGIKQCL